MWLSFFIKTIVYVLLYNIENTIYLKILLFYFLDSYGETLLLFCQGKAQLPYLELDDPKVVVHSHFKMTLYSCDTDLCNGVSAIFLHSAKTYYLLLMTLFFIQPF